MTRTPRRQGTHSTGKHAPRTKGDNRTPRQETPAPRHKQEALPEERGNRSTYWMYGTHPVTAALENAQRKIHRAMVTESALPVFENLLRKRKIAFELVDQAKIERITGAQAVHQGVAISVSVLSETPLEDVVDDALRAGKKRPILLLDQVTDPHNIGAILRSAAAFDALAVVVMRQHAPQETAVLAKSASGALELVPYLIVSNLVQAMEKLKKAGYWVVGMDGQATQSIREAKLSDATAFVMGAEGKGLRRLSAEHCDLMVKLPISAKMESLNVSNAAAIALYELFQA